MADIFKLNHGNTIPEAILPRDKLPRHQKPDFIRIVGFDLSNTREHMLPASYCREEDRRMEILEGKVSTVHNMKEVEAKAYETYLLPLATAIATHGAWRYPVISRVVVFSRTGSTTLRTIAHIHAITTPPPPPVRTQRGRHNAPNVQEEPPDKVTFKDAPKGTQNIIIKIHQHLLLQQWLEAILLAARRDLTPANN